jgi:RNA polymerase sigma factor (sigma-70 family)
MIATNDAAPPVAQATGQSPEWYSRLDASQRRRYDELPESIDWVDHESFHEADAEQRYFGESAPNVEVPHWNSFPEVPEDIDTAQRSKNRLTAAEERELFLRFNYARFRMAEVLDAHARRASHSRAVELLRWDRRVRRLRDQVVRANMALVVSMAKRSRVPNVEFTELVSEGNMALLRAVDKFDASRGFKFSTYACRAILKSFSRLATKTGRYRQHFPTEFDPDLERSDEAEKKHDRQHQNALDELDEVLQSNRANLSELERQIVVERFALGEENQKGRTLKEVGRLVGLTNERVRQIQKVALTKLRITLNEQIGAV